MTKPESEIYWDLSTASGGVPVFQYYDGQKWLPMSPNSVQDDMTKIKILKPKYAQSRYPTKSERRLKREQGLRNEKTRLSAQVESLEEELAALQSNTASRLPNPGSRKMRF